jgi:hypothetical protein
MAGRIKAVLPSFDFNGLPLELGGNWTLRLIFNNEKKLLDMTSWISYIENKFT